MIYCELQFFRNFCKSSFEFEHIAGEKCFAAGFFAQLRQKFIAFVFDRSGFNARNSSQKSGFGRDGENRRFGALGDVNRVSDIGAAESIVAVGDNDNHSSAGRASEFFVGKLPDGIVKRGLRTDIFNFFNGFVEQIEFVRKILTQIELRYQKS